MIKRIAIAAIAGMPVLMAGAQATNSLPPDKSGYDLFHPVPENLMREFSPDRPDETESAYTVDAGHYQWEMDFANFSYDQTDGTTTKAWEAGAFNFRVGLLNTFEIQANYNSYQNVQTETRNQSATHSGLGDFTARAKWNLWGDDSGTTAFALMPYLKFPTSTDHLGNNAIEGGMIFPLSVNLPHDFGLSLETAASYMKDSMAGGYHEEYITSVSLDHQIIGNLSGFVEFFGNFTTENHAGWVGMANTGLAYLVTKNIQLDLNCFFGVTRAAADFNPFAGITIRF